MSCCTHCRPDRSPNTQQAPPKDNFTSLQENIGTRNVAKLTQYVEEEEQDAKSRSSSAAVKMSINTAEKTVWTPNNLRNSFERFMGKGHDGSSSSCIGESDCEHVI